MAFRFSLEMAVRDYECDFQGIVNNAVYLNYLEHTRHMFAKEAGLDVVAMAERGINVVLVRAEIDYKASLRSGDAFVVGLDVERLSRLKFAFDQQIYRLPEAGKDAEEMDVYTRTHLILKARMTATAVNEQGRPFLPPELDVLFNKAHM